jgi:hypothetical protein
MLPRTYFGWLAAFVLCLGFVAQPPVHAQQRQPLTARTGNPTPGTTQPDPPNLADRVAVSGCLRLPTADAPPAVATTTPSDARFVLDSVKRDGQVPADTGTSAAAAAASASSYRLEALESQLSPFIGSRVEVSGEVKPGPAGPPPVLLVETVRKTAGTCS